MVFIYSYSLHAIKIFFYSTNLLDQIVRVIFLIIRIVLKNLYYIASEGVFIIPET